MRIKSVLIYTIILLASHQFVQGQNFQMGVLAGANIAKFNNRDLYHYTGRKADLSAGIFAKVKLYERWTLVSEMLYSKTGKFLRTDDINDIITHHVSYRYIELPLRISYFINPKDQYYSNSLSLGVSCNKLVGFTILDTAGNNISERVNWAKRHALSFNATVTQYFTPRFGLDIRYSLSILKPYWTSTYSARLFYTLFRDNA